MQILVLLGMNFDAVVVFVTSQTLLFRLALTLYNVNSKGFLFGFFYVYKNMQNNLTNYKKHLY